MLINTTQIATQIRQARIAVALERHFLGHQRYPKDLVELVPNYLDVLPKDPMGEVWQYQPSPTQDTYRLYALGWNQVDDGGVPADRRNRETGDIVWTR